MVAEWVEQAGLEEEEGFDRVVEATGAQDPVMLAVAAAKQGGVCELAGCILLEHLLISTDLAVGLGHEQTKVSFRRTFKSSLCSSQRHLD